MEKKDSARYAMNTRYAIKIEKIQIIYIHMYTII
jgi:hypothetical protein